MGDHRSPAAAAGAAIQLRPEDVDFEQQVYGGLQTTNPALIALQRSVLAPQAYQADVDDTNTSGQVTLAYRPDGSRSTPTRPTRRASSRSGLNLNGVPDGCRRATPSCRGDGQARRRASRRGRRRRPSRSAASPPTSPSFNTDIKDYQTQVVNAQVGVLRGYLANAEKVRVRGAEFDGNAKVERSGVALRGARVHGRHLRLVPRRAAAARGHRRPAGQGHLGFGASRHLEVGVVLWRRVHQSDERLRPAGEFFGAVDTSYRSEFSSSSSASQVLDRRRLRARQRARRLPLGEGMAALVWSRNLLDKNYFEFLTAAPGNSGLIVGLPGDPTDDWRDVADGDRQTAVTHDEGGARMRCAALQSSGPSGAVAKWQRAVCKTAIRGFESLPRLHLQAGGHPEATENPGRLRQQRAAG